jgi:colicin import membrane protein
MQLAHAHHERLEFAPPPQRGMLRALVLAILAHALLLAGLSISVRWKSEAPVEAVEAELWAAIPQEAAPKLEVPPPEPEPEPQPVAKAEAPPAPDPTIVLEQERKRRQAEEQLRQQQFLLQQKLEADKQRKLEQERQEQEKKAAEEKRQAELDKRKEAQKKQEDTKKLEAQRQANLRRMEGLAGGTGAPSSTGTAQKSAGPSSSYAGRVQARIRPNIVFSEDAAGNPTAEVEVRTAPDGTIVGRRLSKPSGNKAWDDAVLRAIDKTETLPRDIDGRVPSSLIIILRPKD